MVRLALLAAVAAYAVSSADATVNCGATFVGYLTQAATATAPATPEYTCVTQVFQNISGVPSSVTITQLLTALASDPYYIVDSTAAGQAQLQTAFYSTALGPTGFLSITEAKAGQGTTYFSGLTTSSCTPASATALTNAIATGTYPSLTLLSALNNDFVTACPALSHALLAAYSNPYVAPYISGAIQSVYNALLNYITVVGVVSIYAGLKKCLIPACLSTVYEVCENAIYNQALTGTALAVSQTSFVKASLTITSILGLAANNLTTYASAPTIAPLIAAVDASSPVHVSTPALIAAIATNCTYLAGSASQYTFSLGNAASSLAAGFAAVVAIAATAMAL